MNGDLASEFTNIYNQDTKNEPKNMKHSGLNLIQYVYIYISIYYVWELFLCLLNGMKSPTAMADISGSGRYRKRRFEVS